MPQAAKHPLYSESQERWAVMRDAIEGEEAIKDKKETYLPKPSAMSDGAYTAYMKRATYPEITAPTIRGMHGIMHEVEARIELPKALEPMLKRATKTGLTLEAVLQSITLQMLSTGRYGILADIDKDGNPVIAGYVAEAILNWDVDDQEALSMVVLDETKHRRGIDNAWSKVEALRELRLSEGKYQFKADDGVLNTDAESDESYNADQEGFQDATKKGNKSLEFIPFVFINTLGLSPEPGEVPLFGLARCATAIYQLDADYRKTLFLSSQPQPWVKGMQADDVPDTLGGSEIWLLPEGGGCGYLEFSGVSASAQESAIEKKKAEAVKMGAKMFEETTGQKESGEAFKMRFATATATLRTIAKSSGLALETVLRMLAEWVGANPNEVKVKPHTDFGNKLTVEEANSLINAWQSGAIPFDDLHNNLQKGGWVDRDISAENQLEKINLEAPVLAGPGIVEDA